MNKILITTALTIILLSQTAFAETVVRSYSESTSSSSTHVKFGGNPLGIGTALVAPILLKKIIPPNNNTAQAKQTVPAETDTFV